MNLQRISLIIKEISKILGQKHQRGEAFCFMRSEEFIKDFLNKNSTPASLARAVRSHQYSDAFCDKNTALKAFGNEY